MTDPQLPPPYGAVPPVPPAPGFTAPQPPAFTAPQPPAAYPVPPQAAPPGAYQVPVGGYAVPAGAYAVPAPVATSSKLPGVLALVFALVAAVVTPIVAGVAGFEIGRRIPSGLDASTTEVLTVLSPARDQVLWAEISFWAGTILGIVAIVLGIIAIRRKQGRGLGIGALIVAVLGPIVFGVVLLFAFAAGTATGFLP
ncbi:hypothetical protein [Microbacterium sp. SD291]|uniref:hypothetical protein n=1 Tax=Microbacterium sp. SD291 TaxID=2782007 RepID=UPI001A964F53|nr:hypothetical protein [Microbacterium sp. SD291]MBO0981047.1 hypothetical protein [Microbacterium sp. SD291]